MGAWKPSDFDRDDIQGIIPLPSATMVEVGAIFGATLAALAGGTSAKSLLTGASLGIVASMALFAATGRW